MKNFRNKPLQFSSSFTQSIDSNRSSYKRETSKKQVPQIKINVTKNPTPKINSVRGIYEVPHLKNFKETRERKKLEKLISSQDLNSQQQIQEKKQSITQELNRLKKMNQKFDYLQLQKLQDNSNDSKDSEYSHEYKKYNSEIIDLPPQTPTCRYSSNLEKVNKIQFSSLFNSPETPKNQQIIKTQEFLSNYNDKVGELFEPKNYLKQKEKSNNNQIKQIGLRLLLPNKNSSISSNNQSFSQLMKQMSNSQNNDKHLRVDEKLKFTIVPAYYKKASNLSYQKESHQVKAKATKKQLNILKTYNCNSKQMEGKSKAPYNLCKQTNDTSNPMSDNDQLKLSLDLV